MGLNSWSARCCRLRTSRPWTLTGAAGTADIGSGNRATMGATAGNQTKGAAALEQEHTYTLNDVLGLGFEASCAAVDGTRYLWHGKCGLRVDWRSGTTTMIMDPEDCPKDRGSRPCGAKRRSERGPPASAPAVGERRGDGASLGRWCSAAGCQANWPPGQALAAAAAARTLGQ